MTKGISDWVGSVYAFGRTAKKHGWGETTMRIRRIFALAFGLALLFAADARAQSDYPNRTIRFIVGFAAGGGNDIFARLVVNKFQQNTGYTTIIDNKPGAGGRISSEFVSYAP